MKAVVLRQSPPDRIPVYHDAVVEELSIPTPGKDELLVKLSAVSFNRRDFWIRNNLYPGIKDGNVYGSDGVGVVVGAGNDDDPLLNKRVLLVPMRGWLSATDAPEQRFGILGGTNFPEIGTFAEYIVVERSQVILAPDFIDSDHLAAFPLGGVTAWRAVFVNGLVKQGHSVLITGIGGGVATLALQFCVAKGANVYVTSGSDEKIAKAVSYGAKGGVNYKSGDWPAELGSLLNKQKLNAIIDSAGGDILGQTNKLLKDGGRVVCYGMTASPKITFSIREVLKQHKLLGSTMGSQQDLIDATNFLEQHRIVPVVSDILDGLEQIEKGFAIMKEGSQFGKIVIRISNSETETRLKL